MKRLLTLFSLGLLLFSCNPPEVEVPVSSVTLDRSSAAMTVGETVRLTATVLPADAKDKTVTWKSSQTSVATVSSSGEVTALAEGSSTITASAGGKTATCQVTVKNPVTTIEVSSVTLDKSRLDLTVGGVARLTATVLPADATDKTVTWESSDAAVATVDSEGNVKAVKGGTSTITAKAGGKSASALVDVMEVTPTSVEISADGGSFNISVITTRKYHLSSKPEWVTESSVNGQTYSFEVGANPGTEERSGAIVFCDEEGVCLACNVKQAGGAPVFSISPQKVDMDAAGGTFTVTVTANHPYHLSSTPDWVSQKSFENDVFTFEVAANETVEERSGVVVICDEEGVCLSCNVKQEGVKPFSISPMQVRIGKDGGTFDVTVTSSYGYHLSGKPDWVTEKSVKDKVHTFEVGASPTSEVRSGAITFCDDAGTCLSMTVRQDGDPDIIDWSRDFYHNPFVMNFVSTGSWGYRKFRAALEEAFAQISKRPVTVNMHVWDAFALGDITNTVMDKYGVKNVLTSIIDGRRRLNMYEEEDFGLCLKNYISETEANYPVTTAVGFESSISGQKLDLDVRLYFKQAGDYKVTVFVSESGIVAGQYDDDDEYIENYLQDDIVRMLLTDAEGDAVTASARSIVKRHYSANVPAGCNKENLKLQVVVERTFGTQRKLVDEGCGSGGYYVDNCASGKVGTLVRPAFAEEAGGGNEDVTNGDPVNW